MLATLLLSPENLIPDHPNRSISKHQHECDGPNLTCANLLRRECYGSLCL
jgi:hypothetical protein